MKVFLLFFLFASPSWAIMSDQCVVAELLRSLGPGQESLYDVLEVSQEASLEEIRQAYRKMSRKYHPDTADTVKDSSAKFRAATDAYGILTDSNARAAYDNILGNRRGKVSSARANYGFDPDALFDAISADPPPKNIDELKSALQGVDRAVYGANRPGLGEVRGGTAASGHFIEKLNNLLRDDYSFRNNFGPKHITELLLKSREALLSSGKVTPEDSQALTYLFIKELFEDINFQGTFSPESKALIIETLASEPKALTSKQREALLKIITIGT